MLSLKIYALWFSAEIDLLSVQLVRHVDIFVQGQAGNHRISFHLVTSGTSQQMFMYITEKQQSKTRSSLLLLCFMYIFQLSKCNIKFTVGEI